MGESECRLIDDTILEWHDGGIRLVGSQCTDCGNVAFPPQGSCTRCCGERTERRRLGTEGTLWTWTVQGFPPKSPPYAGPATPDVFRPYGVGYVELPGEVRVESRLTLADPERLEIGMRMRLVAEVLGEDAEGRKLVTFAFAPAEAA